MRVMKFYFVIFACFVVSSAYSAIDSDLADYLFSTEEDYFEEEIFNYKVDVNTAQLDDLLEIPTMTFWAAKKILKERKKRGWFTDMYELEKILPEAYFEMIKDWLEVKTYPWRKDFKAGVKSEYEKQAFSDDGVTSSQLWWRSDRVEGSITTNYTDGDLAFSSGWISSWIEKKVATGELKKEGNFDYYKRRGGQRRFNVDAIVSEVANSIDYTPQVAEADWKGYMFDFHDVTEDLKKANVALKLMEADNTKSEKLKKEAKQALESLKDKTKKVATAIYQPIEKKEKIEYFKPPATYKRIAKITVGSVIPAQGAKPIYRRRKSDWLGVKLDYYQSVLHTSLTVGKEKDGDDKLFGLNMEFEVGGALIGSKIERLEKESASSETQLGLFLNYGMGRVNVYSEWQQLVGGGNRFFSLASVSFHGLSLNLGYDSLIPEYPQEFKVYDGGSFFIESFIPLEKRVTLYSRWTKVDAEDYSADYVKGEFRFGFKKGVRLKVGVGYTNTNDNEKYKSWFKWELREKKYSLSAAFGYDDGYVNVDNDEKRELGFEAALKGKISVKVRYKSVYDYSKQDADNYVYLFFSQSF